MFHLVTEQELCYQNVPLPRHPGDVDSVSALLVDEDDDVTCARATAAADDDDDDIDDAETSMRLLCVGSRQRSAQAPRAQACLKLNCSRAHPHALTHSHSHTHRCRRAVLRLLAMSSLLGLDGALNTSSSSSIERNFAVFFSQPDNWPQQQE